MCSCDDTIVLRLPGNSTADFKTEKKIIKRRILNFLDNLRIIFLVYLLVSPVSCGPLALSGRSSSSSSRTSLKAHSRRIPNSNFGLNEAVSGSSFYPSVPPDLDSPGEERSSSPLQKREPEALSRLSISSSKAAQSHRVRHHSRRSLALTTMENTLPETEIPSGSSSTTQESADSPPNWVNPCPTLDMGIDESATVQSLSMHILRAVLEARSQVINFINDFARVTFGSDSWEDSLKEHADYSVNFLQSASSSVLASPESLEFAEALQKAYELMQRRAVGVEQVTLDQALYQSSFLSEFRHAENKIVHILCEIRHAMVQSGVSPSVEVTKDIMKSEARDIDGERERTLRDAVILREYLELLTVLHSVFKHYASKPSEH